MHLLKKDYIYQLKITAGENSRYLNSLTFVNIDMDGATL